MTIVVTGAGSGGHITPILAVAAELKRLDSQVKIVFIGQKGGKLSDIVESSPYIDECYYVSAGKLRRYSGKGLAQLLDLRTQSLNLRDLTRTVGGLSQSWSLLGKIKPDLVFTRGGYISVPVAIAAWFRRIKYITHDSDSTPSLANRIIAPMASMHAVALDPSIYPYPKSKTVKVGVPISANYSLVSEKDMRYFKTKLGLASYSKVICITGGGNGADKLNQIVVSNVPFLLKKYPDLAIIHIAGRAFSENLNSRYDAEITNIDRKRVIVKGFVTDLYLYSGASDVIIARGGATNLAEFAAQGKACIIIPSTQLIWNVRNARALAKNHAVIELSEDQAEQELRLAHTISGLLDNNKSREELKKKIIQYYVPDSASKIAELIIDMSGHKETQDRK